MAKTGGTVTVQVFSTLDSQPGYGPFVEVAARHAGPEAMQLLGTYWRLGDLDELLPLMESAGLEVTGKLTLMGTAHFDSIEELVRTEVEGSPLIERIDEETYRRIIDDTVSTLSGFGTPDGRAEIPIEGHIVTGRKR